MSGGHFNYDQHKINDIAEEVESILNNNDYSDETREQIKTGLFCLRVAAIYAQRIDWLVSGDDGEESFHARLKEDLDDLAKEE